MSDARPVSTLKLETRSQRNVSRKIIGKLYVQVVGTLGYSSLLILRSSKTESSPGYKLANIIRSVPLWSAVKSSNHRSKGA